jgi:hypothetical protein
VLLSNDTQCKSLTSASLDDTRQYNIDTSLYDAYFNTMSFDILLNCGLTESQITLDFEVEDLTREFTLKYYKSDFTNSPPLPAANIQPTVAEDPNPVEFDDLKDVTEVTYEKLTKNGKNIVRATYTIVDNSEKDSDLQVGIISDPVVLLQNAPIVVTENTTPVPSENTVIINPNGNIQQPVPTTKSTGLIRTGGSIPSIINPQKKS